MALSIGSFSGLAPKVNPPLLAANMATVASNLRVDRGSIRPLKGVSLVASLPSGAQSFFKYSSTAWLYWANANVDIARSPVPNDAWGRIYYTGGEAAYPQYTFSGQPTVSGLTNGLSPNGMRLGVPQPGVGTLASIAKSGTITGTAYNRYYVFCYVTPQGEEGPPLKYPVPVNNITSTETATLTFATETLSTYNLAAGSNVSQSTFVAGRIYTIVTAGDCNWTAIGAAAATVGVVFTYNGLPITGSTGTALYASGFRRIYRTAQGTNYTTFEFVADVPIGITTYADSLVDTQLGEIIPSTSWFPPPAGMIGLKATANGFFIGFTGNTLCVSARFMPHAWPPAYELSFPGTITAIAVTTDSIVVFTSDMPYLVTGTDPASLTAIKIDNPQSVPFRKSAVDMGGYVLAASPDGLIKIVQSQITNATLDYFTYEQWQDYSPSTLRGFFYEGIYIGFSSTKAFMFDMRKAPYTLTTLAGFSTFVAGYNDLSTDILYLLDSTGAIYTWETGALSSFTWKSKPVRVQNPVCPACGRIYANYASGAVGLTLWADGVIKFGPTTISSSESFRLPAGYRAREFTVQLTGTSEVDSISMANSVAELA